MEDNQFSSFYYSRYGQKCRRSHIGVVLNSSPLKFIAWLVLRAEVKVEWLVTKIFWIYLYWCFVSDVVRVDEKLTASRSKNLMFIHGKHEKDVQWCCEGRYKFGRRPSENSRCNNLMYMVGMKEVKDVKIQVWKTTIWELTSQQRHKSQTETFVFIHCWPLAWKSFRCSYLPIILNNHHQKRSSYQCNVETSWVGDFFAIIEWNSWSYLLPLPPISCS